MRHKTVLMATTIAIIPSCPYGCYVPVIKSIKIIVSCPSKGTEDNEVSCSSTVLPEPQPRLALGLQRGAAFTCLEKDESAVRCARKTKFYSNSKLAIVQPEGSLGTWNWFPPDQAQAAAAFLPPRLWLTFL